jgi:hypothetical protein
MMSLEFPSWNFPPQYRDGGKNMLSNERLKQIFQKTKGHCHFCGDAIALKKYAFKGSSETGAWELDHVIQKGKDGNDFLENYLPACIRCNRLRWHRKGAQLRDLIFLGLIVKDEIRRKSNLGKALQKLKSRRLAAKAAAG